MSAGHGQHERQQQQQQAHQELHHLHLSHASQAEAEAGKADEGAEETGLLEPLGAATLAAAPTFAHKASSLVSKQTPSSPTSAAASKGGDEGDKMSPSSSPLDPLTCPPHLPCPVIQTHCHSPPSVR